MIRKSGILITALVAVIATGGCGQLSADESGTVGADSVSTKSPVTDPQPKPIPGCELIDFSALSQAASDDPSLRLSASEAAQLAGKIMPGDAALALAVITTKEELAATGFPAGMLPPNLKSEDQMSMLVEHGTWARDDLTGLIPRPDLSDKTTYGTLIVLFTETGQTLASASVPDRPECFKM